MKKAVDEVDKCRMTLKWTYAMAYYLDKGNEKELFEDNQRLVCALASSVRRMLIWFFGAGIWRRLLRTFRSCSSLLSKQRISPRCARRSLIRRYALFLARVISSQLLNCTTRFTCRSATKLSWKIPPADSWKEDGSGTALSTDSIKRHSTLL